MHFEVAVVANAIVIATDSPLLVITVALIAAPGLGVITLWLGDFQLSYGCVAGLALLTAVSVGYLPQRL